MSDVVAKQTVELDSASNRDPGSPDLISQNNKQTDSDKNTDTYQHESEYDTASESSPSDDERHFEEEDDDEEDEDGRLMHSGDDEDLEEEEDDDEEFEDQPEQTEEGLVEKKKVDDDEDRSNPQYIPKKGTFYEHDDRTAENPDKPEGEEDAEKGESEMNTSTTTVSPLPTKATKKASGADRWSHDRYDMNEQAPKSRAELVSAYGYDIRSEDGPPKVKRNKHYGRGPNKYLRNWEDEAAYGKPMMQKRNNPPHQGEKDFPRLGARNSKKSSPSSVKSNDREEMENNDENSRYPPKPSNRRIPRSSEQGQGGQRFGRGMNNNTREYKNSSKNNRTDYQSSKSFSSNNRTNNNSNSRNKMGNPVESSYNGNSMSFTNSNLGNSHRKMDSSYESRFKDESGDGSKTSSSLSSKPSRSQGEEKPSSGQFNQQQSVQGAVLSQSNSNNSTLNEEESVSHQRQPKRYSVKRQRNEGQNQQQNHVQYSQEPIQDTLQQQQAQQQQQMLPNASNQVPQQLVHQVQQPPQQQQQQLIQPTPFIEQQKLVRMDQYESQKQSAMMNQQQQQQQQPPPPQQQQQQGLPQTQYTNYYPSEYLPQNPAQIAAQQQQQQQFSAPYQYQTAAAPPPQQQAPAFIQTQQQPAPNPQQILNYVPAQQSQAQFTQYPGYQNYTAVATPNVIHQTSGLTYYATPAPQPRPVLPQRRPTNAIPILAPPERSGGKGRGRLVSAAAPAMESQETGQQSQPTAADSASNAENIDHILDNMFVQRAPIFPIATAASSGASSSSRNKGGDDAEKVTKSDPTIEEGVKDMKIVEAKPVESVAKEAAKSETPADGSPTAEAGN